MTLRDWQGIVFDLDDTLYPERDYVLSGFKAVASWAEARLGVPSLGGFSGLRRLFDKKVRGNIFQLWLEELGVPDTYGLVTRLVDIYRNHDPLLVPFPEVPGILRELSSRYRLGLLSDGYLGVQQRKLAALSLGGYFHGIVFSDSWGRENWKPSQRPFKEIANLLSLEPSRIVYVADNPLKDFLGARESGMFTVRLRRQEVNTATWIPLLNSMRHMSRLVPSKCSLASCCRGPQKSLEKVGDLFQPLDLAHTDAKRLKNSLAQNPSFTRS